MRVINQTGLERELADLKREALLMHNRTANTLTLASEALLESNPDKARRAIKADSEIDEWQGIIEHHCLEIIARHQLIARDARLVTGVLSSVADFERTGDYAAHIAEDVPVKDLEHQVLGSVLALLGEMMRDLGRAMDEEDATMALRVARQDETVDQLTGRLNELLLQRHITDQSALVAALRVVRGLQRIGDHIENIAERVAFWVNGSTNTRH